MKYIVGGSLREPLCEMESVGGEECSGVRVEEFVGEFVVLFVAVHEEFADNLVGGRVCGSLCG